MRPKNTILSMNKIRYFIIFIFLFHCPNIFAYVNQGDLNPNLIYCPDKVECVANGEVGDGQPVPNSYCHPDYDKQAYVDRMMHYGRDGRVYKGDYTFQAAYANYQYPHSPWVAEVLCRYKKGDSWIGVTYKAAANLEVFYDKSTHWNIGHGISVDQNSTCEASNSSLCPLVEKPELVIGKKLNSNPYIFASIKIVAN